jgi:hypothetical protein
MAEAPQSSQRLEHPESAAVRPDLKRWRVMQPDLGCREILVVVLEAKMRNQFLAVQMPQSILQLHHLDE